MTQPESTAIPAIDSLPDGLPGVPLTNEHREYLISQGISPDYIDLPRVKAGLHSITEWEQLPDEWRGTVDRDTTSGIVFGWGVDELLIPQWRPDFPLEGLDGEAIQGKYRFLRGHGANVVLRSAPETAEMVGIPLIVAEGTKQGMACGAALADQDIAVTSIPGCWSWKSGKVVSPELVQLAKGKSEVIVILDADATTNRTVYDAGMALKKTLTRRSRSVRFVQLPALAEGEKSGLDDYLARIPVEDREQAILGLLEAALSEPALARPAAKIKEGSPDSFFSLNGSLLPDKLVSAILAQNDLLIDPKTWSIAAYDEESGVYKIHPDDRHSPTVKRATYGLLKHRYHDRHVSTVESVLRLELEMRGLFVEPPKGNLVHVNNGWLNTVTRELLPHSPHRRSLYKFAVDYIPGADCTKVTAFLKRATTLSDGSSQVEQVWDAMSQLLETEAPRKALSLSGPIRSGKGTTARLLEAMVPEELRCGVGLKALSEDSHSSAVLYGKSLNIIGEAEQVFVADTSVFNKALGGDLLHFNPKHKSPFTARNTALWVFMHNDLPQIVDPSGAFVARLTPVRFVESHAGREDQKLGERLLKELPGVLNALLDALDARRARGGSFLPGHPEVLEHYNTETNPVHQFWTECIQIAPDEAWSDNGSTAERPLIDEAWCTGIGDIYRRYKEFCEQTGRHALRQGRLESILTIPPFGLAKARTKGNARGYACRAMTYGISNPSAAFTPDPDARFSDRNGAAGRAGIDAETGEVLVWLPGRSEPVRYPAPPAPVEEPKRKVTPFTAPKKAETSKPLPEMFPLPDLSEALIEAMKQVEETRGDSPNHLTEVLESSRRNKSGWAVGDMSGIHTLGVQHLRRVGADDDVVAEYLGILRDLWKANPRYNADGSPSKH